VNSLSNSLAKSHSIQTISGLKLHIPSTPIPYLQLLPNKHANVCWNNANSSYIPEDDTAGWGLIAGHDKGKVVAPLAGTKDGVHDSL
jgi:hypothetical protein